MKKLFLALSLFVTISTQVFAFTPQVSIFVNREVAIARVWNHSMSPMVCSGATFGMTYSGLQLNAWFNNMYVAPGGHADAYVYSNYYDPFVNAWAQIDCRYAW